MNNIILLLSGLLFISYSPNNGLFAAQAHSVRVSAYNITADLNAGTPPFIENKLDITPISWETNAAGFAGEEGRTYRFRCPANGIVKTIYGSDIYTDDSSICTAAAHAGIISIERGGVVTIKIRRGRATYGSTTRHGIKSTSYGQWGRSFVFISSEATPEGGNRGGDNSPTDRTNSDREESGDVTPIAWDTNAAGFKGEEGRTYRFRCPSDGTAGTIYGSDVYTDDSSICTAAAHAGIISIERGGRLEIEIRPGRSIYGSTTRHGIKSNTYGQWGRSFVVRQIFDK